ncbi:MAG: hypothetical protein ACOYBX_13600, partial [Mycobacterium sp.]
GWFGTSGSVATILITCATVGLACVVAWRSGEGHRSVGRPIGITLALTVVSAVLGFSSYFWCHDDAHPPFVTSLLWTGGVIRGGLDDRRVAPGMGLCPAHAPVALELAKIAALAALLVGIAGIATALLESRLDRFRLRFDSSITAIVGADNDADSMVAAIARTLEKGSKLLVVTTPADAEHRGELRRRGGRVVAVDFGVPDVLQSLPIWHKVTRLYLLSPEPNTNLLRLGSINGCLPASRTRRPLTVRIDDPWQAEAWRTRQLGGSDARWAGDAIGKYEVTAHRLLDQIVDEEQVDTVIVCGTTPLTLALCANLTRRRLERNFYSEPADSPLPSLTIVGRDADEYRQNQEIHLAQQGLVPSADWLKSATEGLSASTIAALVRHALNGRPVGAAVIIADTTADPMLGTMLATRLPEIPVYAHAPDAPETLDVPAMVGRLRTYRLSMDLPPGHSQDVWERAAKLIHNRYIAQLPGSSPAAKPWAQLDEFYRGSNRRQVRNALWMVEKIAGRTWDSSTAPAGPTLTSASDHAEPLSRLAQLGIDPAAAMAMAEAEHRDWCRYYREAGWHDGPVRDDARKIHDGLVSWQSIENDPVALNRALTSLASTLSALQELGYRSRPEWQQFRRTGTVVAQRHTEPWLWMSASGQTMNADGGDWEVRGTGNETWSVRDDIFRSTHEQLDGTHWRRTGIVEARKAHAGEVIDTLEGPLTAQSGDWIVRGSAGEQWPVRPEIFRQQYEGPLSAQGSER